MTGLGTVLRRFIRCRVSGPACRCSPPAPDPAPTQDEGQASSPFGSTLTELRCALACYDLVDEVVHADGDGPTERDKLAFIYAGWALACAAGRAERCYARGIGAERAP